MNAEIIAVGSELLLGQINNTNAKFLSKELAEIGVNVYYHTVVGDNHNRLKNVIEIAQNRADLLIFTGGLGPTKDDLTKETIAEVLDVPLVFDKKSLTYIEQYFESRKIKTTDNNKKQAYVFKGSTILPNDNGMAPGILLTKDEKSYLLLPGPPREMELMFSKYGKPSILELMDLKERIVSKVLRFFGIGEAALENELQDLIDSQTNPTIAPLAAEGEVTLRITAKHTSEKICKEMIEKMESLIKGRVGQYLYGYDDTSIVEEMGHLLQKKNLTLAAAESLTGGLFQEEVTSIAGVSDWYKGGIVAYWPEIKQNILHVEKEAIEKHGVVSRECAIEMAENVREIFGTDIGISFTGVAGPKSLEGKSPGTVFIAISISNQPTQTYQLNLNGNREGIRVKSVKNGAWKILELLQK